MRNTQEDHDREVEGIFVALSTAAALSEMALISVGTYLPAFIATLISGRSDYEVGISTLVDDVRECLALSRSPEGLTLQ